MANNRRLNGLAESPAANGTMMVAPRPRGLWGQIGLLIFQPGTFFDLLRQSNEVQQWFWAALLVLGLTAFSTVRTRLPAADTTTTPDSDISAPVDMGGGGGGGGELGLDFGAPPPEALGNSSAAAPGEETVSEQWQRGAIAASNIILAWLILIALLCQASLANGKAPNLGKNLQIAVWACLPLALMAALQLIYDWGGGEIGQPGLSGLLPEWSGYQDLSKAQQKIALSLANRFTLFEWWAVILAYVGARQALRARRWIAGYIVLTWVVLIVILPVLAGSVKLPENEPITSPTDEILPEEMMPFEEVPFEEVPSDSQEINPAKKGSLSGRV